MLRPRSRLLITMLLTLPAAAWAGTPAPSSRLSAVIVARTDVGVRVTLRGTARVVPQLVSAVGQLPPRIVIDLPDVAPGDVPPRTNGIDDLQAVRVVARADGSTRVTLDLVRPMAYRVVPTTPESGTFMLDLEPLADGHAPRPAGTATPAATADESPGPSPLVQAANAAQAAVSQARRASAQVPARVPPATPEAGGRRTAGSSAASTAARPIGRASFYTHAARVQSGDTSRAYAEFASSVTFQLPDRGGDGIEYGLDLRHAGYTLAGRTQRLSIYDGYIGQRLGGGTIGVRAGHMWLNDLGGLGSIAGGLVEVRQPATQTTAVGRWRGGVFGGLEPQVYETGYADRVRKIGGYVALDGGRSRRHVLGYVRVRHGDVVERSALTFTNYVPIRSFSLYQAGEYDLSGPGGAGNGGLTYFFTNARASLGPRVEVMGTYNRGRSIDARGMSEDILMGRAVSQRAIEGLLYRSMGGRVTLEVLPKVRAYVGYSRDRNNRDDRDTGRWLTGGYASDLFGSGLDLALSDSRIERPSGNYHSTYVSLGRQAGRRVYLTGDYTTSLALVRFVRGDGVVIDLQPQTRRFGGSGVITLSRNLTLLVTVEETLDDDVDELRVLSGLSVRFR